MHERDFWLTFSVCSGVGPKKFALLLERFGTAKNAWESSETELLKILGPALSKKLSEFRQNISLENYLLQLKKKNVWFLTLLDKDYPERLREIDNPPFLLFGKGNKEVFKTEKMIGVVGTRKVTSYGQQVTEMIVQDLVNAGFIIVSGLAMGVDAIAHKTTLSNKGKTIAVLGCGVDCCTPRENEQIYNDIIESGGAIISEFPLSMMPSKGSFPSRNRIIAGMSEAVVVTEGAEDSGSLITAGDALRFGRKVFAIPGPITSYLSNGPMRLIRKGAVLVTSGEDILKEFQISNAKFPIANNKIIKGETIEEQKIIDLLQNESLSFDELVKKSKISASSLGSLLSIMELKGYVKTLPDSKIILF